MGFNTWEKRNGRKIKIVAIAATEEDVRYWLRNKTLAMLKEGYRVAYKSATAVSFISKKGDKGGNYSYISYPDN